MTGVKLEKIPDINKYLFIEKGPREGISYIAKRYAKTNNKHMKDYDPKKLSKFIIYLDMNNLYGWAMSEYLPYERYKRLKNFEGFDVMSIDKESKTGCFLEVDLEYLDELHVLHNDYPLAPENLQFLLTGCQVTVEKIADKYGVKVGDVKNQFQIWTTKPILCSITEIFSCICL